MITHHHPFHPLIITDVLTHYVFFVYGTHCDMSGLVGLIMCGCVDVCVWVRLCVCLFKYVFVCVYITHLLAMTCFNEFAKKSFIFHKVFFCKGCNFQNFLCIFVGYQRRPEEQMRENSRTYHQNMLSHSRKESMLHKSNHLIFIHYTMWIIIWRVLRWLIDCGHLFL